MAAPPRSMSPEDVELALLEPLFGRLTSLMVAHGSAIVVCLLAMVRMGGPWPTGFLVANLFALAARLGVLLLHRRLGEHSARRLRVPFQAVGLFWGLMTSGLCLWCLVNAQDETLRLLGLGMPFAMAGGIASRNAATPGYARILVVVWLGPSIIGLLLMQTDNWPLATLATFNLVTLRSIVLTHHAGIRALIYANRDKGTTQAALQARELELQTLFESAAAGLAEEDLITRRIVRVNPAFCQMTGRSEQDLLQVLTMDDVTHPDDLPTANARWPQPCRIGQTDYHERRILRPDGTIVWARVTSWLTAVEPDGRPSRAVGMAQDCTAERTAEEALRTSEELLRLSLSVGGIGSFRREYTTGLIHCGMETRLMHGLPVDDRPVPVAIWRRLAVPEDLERVEKEVAAAHARRQTHIEAQYRFIHPERGLRHIETRSRTEYAADGTPTMSIGVAIDVTEQLKTQEHITHLAQHDALTSLPNRSLFRIRLDAAFAQAERGRDFALFCIDLDHFKDVNDTLGHPVGDALLRAVTERLQAVTRPTDTVARLGGDEFALIQADVERPEDAAGLADRLIAAVSAPYTLDGYQVVIGASVGIAIGPTDGADPETLMRRADVALYAAKSEGRGRFRLFERRMDAEIQSRRSLEQDLRHALERSEFEVFYQPVVDIANGNPSGFEALLRWRHPTRGLVPPDRFIPLAETTGLIVPIGAWVLRAACAEAARWPDGIRVAVNLSAVQFAAEGLVDTVLAALQAAKLPPERLEVEITETVMLQDTAATLRILHALKLQGVTIALDDFGTGYSSLSYLQRFPFDKVKIDRSFTMNLGNKRESAAIVSAVIDLCSSLDMRTTAEGVETEGQLRALADSGCHEAQGYLFSPPRPAADVPALIAGLRQPARTAMTALA